MSIPERVGRYRVVRLLGTGASSSVFLARDTDLDTDVALKILADHLAHREEVVQSFLREGRLLRTVIDERVLPVHDVGTLDTGQPYLVCAVAEHGSLDARLASLESDGWRPDADAVLTLGRELASGLAAIHAAGIVHGDLKPANIFLRGGAAPDASDTDGEARSSLLQSGERLVIGDFGVAVEGGGTAHGASAGYAPPEQERGEAVDERSDLYSATAVIRRLVLGAPAAAPSDNAVPARFAGLGAFLDRGLAPDPAGRPPTVAVWLEELEASLQPSSPRRPPLALVAAGVAVAAALVTAAVVITRDDGEGLDRPVALGTSADAAVAVLDIDGDVLVWEDGSLVPLARGPAIGADLALLDDDALVAFANDHEILRISASADPLAYAGTGRSGFLGDGDAADEARLSRPSSVAVTDDGTLFVVDTGNNRIREIRADGVIRTVAGSGSPGRSGDGGSALDARLDWPAAVAATDDGIVFITEPAACRVRVVVGGNIHTLTGSGSRGFSGDDGPASEATLDDPRGLALSPDGAFLYIADAGNHRVRRIELDAGATDGTITTVAGTGRSGTAGLGGDATDAELEEPTDVAVAEDGSVLIVDRDRLLRITPDGRLAEVS